jgi:hypothetical protein
MTYEKMGEVIKNALNDDAPQWYKDALNILVDAKPDEQDITAALCSYVAIFQKLYPDILAAIVVSFAPIFSKLTADCECEACQAQATAH